MLIGDNEWILMVSLCYAFTRPAPLSQFAGTWPSLFLFTSEIKILVVSQCTQRSGQKFSRRIYWSTLGLPRFRQNTSQGASNEQKPTNTTADSSRANMWRHRFQNASPPRISRTIRFWIIPWYPNGPMGIHTLMLDSRETSARTIPWILLPRTAEDSASWPWKSCDQNTTGCCLRTREKLAVSTEQLGQTTETSPSWPICVAYAYGRFFDCDIGDIR